jgi:hypothetical protein
MKRWLICALAAFISLAMSASAAHAGVSWQLGVKGGVNIVTLEGDDVEYAGQSTAFLAGGAVLAQLHRNFGIEVEVLFARKGAKHEIYDFKAEFDYIEIPILAAALLPVGETVDLMLYAGPSVSFNIAAKVAGEDVKDQLTETDVGAVAGTAVMIDMGSFNLTLEARYTLGLKSIDKIEEDDMKNAAIGIMAGLMFPLGGE